MINQQACFHQTGIPSEVIQLQDQEISAPSQNQALVKMLYSPIHPADINILEGKYSHQPNFPAVGGIEGVGEVVKVNSPTSALKKGDTVIMPKIKGLWQNYLLADVEELIVLPPNVSTQDGAMAFVNPLTAKILLLHFQTLKPGDWIVQNGANSSVGRFIIQLCRRYGFKSFNMVRSESQFDELYKLGADKVCLYSDIDKNTEEIKNASLGFNCIGGNEMLKVAQLLSYGAELITYGAMSGQPLKIPNQFLIFKNLRLKGFSLRFWLERHSSKEIAQELLPLFDDIEFSAPEEIYPLKEIKQGLMHAQSSNRKGKILLNLQGGHDVSQ